MYPRAFNGSIVTKRTADMSAEHAITKRHLHAVPQVKAPPARDLSFAEDIPPPDSHMIQKLAIYGYEVLDGSRTVAQLGCWITRDVAEELTARRAARTERRTLYKDNRRFVPLPGSVHLSQVSSRVAEATVILQTEVRATAVAIRLEFLHKRWRATVLTVL